MSVEPFASSREQLYDAASGVIRVEQLKSSLSRVKFMRPNRILQLFQQMLEWPSVPLSDHSPAGRVDENSLAFARRILYVCSLQCTCRCNERPRVAKTGVRASLNI
jgi:hypothetical protein